jgi:GntR family transcriptional regulator, arabinose operon transcriptional repressor
MNRNLLENGKGEALYRKLADVLRQHIHEGSLSEGGRLATEFELSKIYGVSRGTVRQALGLLEDEGLIKRVPGLGTFTRSNQIAEAGKVAQPHTIGLITPFAHDQLSLDILLGAENAVKFRGFHIVFHYSKESLEEEKEDIARLRAIGVSGIIIFPVSNCEYDEAIWQLQDEHFPYILVDRYFPNLDSDYVVSDNFGGGYRATEHLIILGYAEIAFVYHSLADFRTTSVRDRFQGYQKALADYNIKFEPEWVVAIEEISPSGSEDNSACFIPYLERSHRPVAHFVVNDTTAIDLLVAAARLGIKIPDNLAVVGFDNLKVGAQVQYPLTTVSQTLFDLGVKSAHLLIDRIEGRHGPPEHIVLPTGLVVRESCGARQHVHRLPKA